MNKSELIDKLAEEADLSKSSAHTVVDSFIKIISQVLAEGDEVSLIGFGTFAVKHRPERQGRNPKTGEPISIKASQVPAFKAGKALKEAVNS